MPTLGNRVFVGVNAVVVGKVTVGDDVAIAANSLVIGNVPSGSVMMGVPARIVGAAGSKDLIRPPQAAGSLLSDKRLPIEAGD